MDYDLPKLERRIVKRFRQALTAYELLSDGDSVLVGISGGKDSLCLLELLAQRAKIHRPSFRVEALHVSMENIGYATDTDYLRDFADRLGVRLHVESATFEPYEGTRKPICFLCSWHRRKVLFNKAQEWGFNKIALGHHKDDILHTALMNLFSQGHFATMPARLTMRKMPLTIIRPLCLESEDDLRMFAESRGYKRQPKTCPYETASSRASMKDILAEAEKINPDARNSIWNALEAEGKLVE